jgi:predicted patatin/cPLA2 family phospholipase
LANDNKVAHPVRDLILKRAAEKSQPGRRADSARLALCIEGGAMRGVVSAGMGVGLEVLGLRDVFDGVFGASAGAINGAYFVGGHIAFGTRIYSEDINNRSFIDFWRPVRGRPIVDVDYAVFDAVAKRKPLAVDRIVNDVIPLHALATDVERGESTTLSGFANGNELLSALRAGSTMPIVAGAPYRFRDRLLWDPMLLPDTIPVHAAERLGYTHILALLTRPAGLQRPGNSALDKYFIAPRIGRYSARLADRFLNRSATYRSVIEHIDTEHQRPNSPRILAVRPSRKVGQLEKNAHTLIQGAHDGADAAIGLFSANQPPAGEVLAAFSTTGRRPTLDRVSA